MSKEAPGRSIFESLYFKAYSHNYDASVKNENVAKNEIGKQPYVFFFKAENPQKIGSRLQSNLDRPTNSLSIVKKMSISGREVLPAQKMNERLCKLFSVSILEELQCIFSHISANLNASSPISLQVCHNGVSFSTLCPD